MCHWLACLWALTLELVDDRYPKWPPGRVPDMGLSLCSHSAAGAEFCLVTSTYSYETTETLLESGMQ